MMTHEMVAERRRSGIALTAGIMALWLSVLPMGGFALVLRIAGLAGFVLAVRWAVDPSSPTRRKIASLGVVLGAMVQLQNFFFRLTLTPESNLGDYTRYFLGENVAPALLLLGMAILPRLGRRRAETALLWVSFSLAAVFAVVGTGNGTMMAVRGDPSPAFYQGLVISLRSISLAPALAAAIMLLVPAREVLTEDQAMKRVEALQAQTRASLREAVDALDEAAVKRQSEPVPSASMPPPVVAASMTVNSAHPDILTMLESRLARGEISEATYLQLRAKYGDR